MAKRRLSLRVRIPPYAPPRNIWRQKLHAAIADSQLKRAIKYDRTDRLEVHAKIYMHERHLKTNDVDNRVKDILDALQGRAGGSKAERFLDSIVPNDNQIFRVVVEKEFTPPQSRGFGHLSVRRYKPV